MCEHPECHPVIDGTSSVVFLCMKMQQCKAAHADDIFELSTFSLISQHQLVNQLIIPALYTALLYYLDIGCLLLQIHIHTCTL